MMFIMEECNLWGWEHKKMKNKRKTSKHLTHTDIRMAPKDISSVKWMPLRIPSPTTESVPTLLHINSFSSLYLQHKSNPNQTGTKTELDYGVKTSSKTALLVDCWMCLMDPTELIHPCDLQKTANTAIPHGISRVCESQALNSPVSQPRYFCTLLPHTGCNTKNAPPHQHIPQRYQV